MSGTNIIRHREPPTTPCPRFDHPSLINRPNINELLDKLHALAPYDANVSFNFLRLKYTEHQTKPNYEQCQELYKPVLPYATYAMAEVAETVEDQPERYETLMADAAAVDPFRYYQLADYFRGRNVTEKTAFYLEKAIELGPDGVMAANHSDWLIKYYLKKGERQKAKTLADMAGEAYSADGLEAKAYFLEATGDYDGAFEWYAKEEERYEMSAPLMQFCARYEAKTGNSRFAAQLRSRMTKYFPHGIEKVTFSDFKSAPTDGVLVREENALLRDAGIHSGDVIVAVYGIRVHTFDQYGYARETDPDPEMTLIVWRGNQYREIKASPPEHRFGVDMVDYTR
jgi:tetratricopeptide (TPR) repeat protein